MKKITNGAVALALCCGLLTGCGCMNSNMDATVPSTYATTPAPTTAATQPPITVPHTHATEAATNPTDMHGHTSETAGQDGMVNTVPDTTAETDHSRSRSVSPK